jgi:hypothetical protein
MGSSLWATPNVQDGTDRSRRMRERVFHSPLGCYITGAEEGAQRVTGQIGKASFEPRESVQQCDRTAPAEPDLGAMCSLGFDLNPRPARRPLHLASQIHGLIAHAK